MKQKKKKKKKALLILGDIVSQEMGKCFGK